MGLKKPIWKTLISESPLNPLESDAPQTIGTPTFRPPTPQHPTAVFILTIAPIFYAPAPHTAPLRPSSEALSNLPAERLNLAGSNAGYLPHPLPRDSLAVTGIHRPAAAAVKGLTREDTQRRASSQKRHRHRLNFSTPSSSVI